MTTLENFMMIKKAETIVNPDISATTEAAMRHVKDATPKMKKVLEFIGKNKKSVGAGAAAATALGAGAAYMMSKKDQEKTASVLEDFIKVAEDGDFDPNNIKEVALARRAGGILPAVIVGGTHALANKHYKKILDGQRDMDILGNMGIDNENFDAAFDNASNSMGASVASASKANQTNSVGGALMLMAPGVQSKLHAKAVKALDAHGYDVESNLSSRNPGLTNLAASVGGSFVGGRLGAAIPGMSPKAKLMGAMIGATAGAGIGGYYNAKRSLIPVKKEASIVEDHNDPTKIQEVKDAISLGKQTMLINSSTSVPRTSPLHDQVRAHTKAVEALKSKGYTVEDNAHSRNPGSMGQMSGVIGTGVGAISGAAAGAGLGYLASQLTHNDSFGRILIPMISGMGGATLGSIAGGSLGGRYSAKKSLIPVKIEKEASLSMLSKLAPAAYSDAYSDFERDTNESWSEHKQRVADHLKSKGYKLKDNIISRNPLIAMGTSSLGGSYLGQRTMENLTRGRSSKVQIGAALMGSALGAYGGIRAAQIAAFNPEKIEE